eukprot:TRINITY_DN7982_c1_g1_i1.p1 TRINITY_DN7982_c1_g1~~TRINITY_DN7982_c1_g1_i1.p1  ORF type:complete len:1455 (+),score=295.90 TRINITY_DN7982_c1_g1_i1:1330-5694(+)
MPPRKAVIHPTISAWTHRSTIFACVVNVISDSNEPTCRVAVVGPSMLFVCDEEGGVKRTVSMKKINKVTHLDDNILISLDDEKEPEIRMKLITDSRNLEDPNLLSEIIATAAKKEVIRTKEVPVPAAPAPAPVPVPVVVRQPDIPTRSTPAIEKNDRPIEDPPAPQPVQHTSSPSRTFTSPLAPLAASPPRRVPVDDVGIHSVPPTVNDVDVDVDVPVVRSDFQRQAPLPTNTFHQQPFALSTFHNNNNNNNPNIYNTNTNNINNINNIRGELTLGSTRLREEATVKSSGLVTGTEHVRTPSQTQTPSSYLKWLTEQRSEGKRLCEELNNVMDSANKTKSTITESDNKTKSNLITVVPIAPPTMYSVPDIDIPTTRTSSVVLDDVSDSNSTAPPKFMTETTSSFPDPDLCSESSICTGNQLWVDMTDRLVISSGVRVNDMSGALTQTLHSVFKNSLKFNSLQSGLLLSEWRRRAPSLSLPSSSHASLLVQDLHARLSKYRIKLMALLPSPLVLFSLVCSFLKFNFIEVAVLETAWPRLSGMNYLEVDDYPASVWSDLIEKLKKASNDNENEGQSPTDIFESCLGSNKDAVADEGSVQLLLNILSELGYNLIQSAVLYCEWLRRRSHSTHNTVWDNVTAFLQAAISTTPHCQVTLKSLNILTNTTSIPNLMPADSFIISTATSAHVPPVHASAFGTGDHVVNISNATSPGEYLLRLTISVSYASGPSEPVSPSEAKFNIKCVSKRDGSRSMFLWMYASWFLNESIRKDNNICLVINITELAVEGGGCFSHHDATAAASANQNYSGFVIGVNEHNFQPPITSDVLVIGCEPKVDAAHRVTLRLTQNKDSSKCIFVTCDITRRATTKAAGIIILHQGNEVNLSKATSVVNCWRFCSRFIATRASVTPNEAQSTISIENVNTMIENPDISPDEMDLYIEVSSSPAEYFETCEFGTGPHTVFVVKRDMYSEVMIRVYKIIINVAAGSCSAVVSSNRWDAGYLLSERFLREKITSNVASGDAGIVNHSVVCSVDNITETVPGVSLQPLPILGSSDCHGTFVFMVPNTEFVATVTVDLVELDNDITPGDKSILQAAKKGSNSLKQLQVAGTELEALASQLKHNSRGQFKALDMEAESLRQQLAEQKRRAEEEIRSLAQSGISELHASRGRISALQSAIESGLLKLKESLSGDPARMTSNVAYLRNVIEQASSALVIPHPVVPVVKSDSLPSGLLEISNIRIVPKHTNPSDITLLPPDPQVDQPISETSSIDPQCWGTSSQLSADDGTHSCGAFNYIINKGEGGINISSSIALHNRSTASVTDLVRPTAGQFFMTADAGAAVGAAGGCHIDFDLNRYRLRPSAYTLEHGVRKSSAFALRNWILEASTDNISWTVLAEHHNDQHLGQNQSYTWPLAEGAGGGHFFQYFRIRLTSPCSNSTSWCICLSSVEFFGTLRTATEARH